MLYVNFNVLHMNPQLMDADIFLERVALASVLQRDIMHVVIKCMFRIPFRTGNQKLI